MTKTYSKWKTTKINLKRKTTKKFKMKDDKKSQNGRRKIFKCNFKLKKNQNFESTFFKIERNAF